MIKFIYVYQAPSCQSAGPLSGQTYFHLRPPAVRQDLPCGKSSQTQLGFKHGQRRRPSFVGVLLFQTGRIGSGRGRTGNLHDFQQTYRHQHRTLVCLFGIEWENGLQKKEGEGPRSSIVRPTIRKNRVRPKHPTVLILQFLFFEGFCS